MTPEKYCQERAAKSGSSFYYSFLFLPPPQRRAITALYAFCREVDDVVDECREPEVARATLAWWREEVGQLFAGNPQHPVTRALVPAVERYNLPEEQFQEIIDGMEMDLDQNRYPTFTELRLYCHRAAGVVGQLSAEIFGYSDRQTTRYAHDLGIAFQLTNIIRDVGEDAARDRIYLPQDEMAKYGVTAADLRQGETNEPVRALLAMQIRRAREYYGRAFSRLPEEDRYPQRAGLIMAAIYLHTLDRIEQAGCPITTTPLRLSPWRKLWIAWRTARGEAKRHRRTPTTPR